MMMENLLFFVHGALLLLFGISLSAAFAGIRFTKKNTFLFLGLCAFCGGLQLIAYALFTASALWELYPVNTHIPLILFLCIVYRKKVTTAMAAVFTAYLCCQPAKWCGVLAIYITNSTVAEYLARITALLIVSFITLKYLAIYLSEIFNKDTRSVCIFGMMPMIYYLFDYATVIYTDLWTSNNRVIAEFLPFFLGITYMIFCSVYYREYEQKTDAERKEQIIRIMVDRQGKEIEAIKRSEQEVRLLRHDMRLLLSSLAVCIENGEHDKAQEIISSYSSHIEGTKVEYFCKKDAVNYVLSDFAAKCRAKNVVFTYTIEVDEMKTDEILFSSILSNALDNALNAQEGLGEGMRNIRLMLKTDHGKLLLSVENPTADSPAFADGLPITTRKGHGYGAQSIRYMTERLGGNCQFTMQDNTFIVRVVI